jgi:hypothetical protein
MTLSAYFPLKHQGIRTVWLTLGKKYMAIEFIVAG